MKHPILWAAALAAAIAAPATLQAQVINTVGGEAFGASVNTPTAKQDKAALATLVPDSGLAEASLLSLSVAAIGNPIPGGTVGTLGFISPTLGTTTTALTTNELDASSSGAVGENASSAQGSANVANVNILQGVVTAEQVTALVSSASNGVRASSNSAGSGFLGLSVNGVFMGDVTPAPNTQIAVPGVGVVILNEQIPSGDGIHTSGLQVNMIHVVLKDAVTGATTGDIIVGSAKSSVGFAR
jgi:hypothetical protein